MQYELLEEQGRARKSKEEQGRARKSKEEQGRAKEMLMLAIVMQNSGSKVQHIPRLPHGSITKIIYFYHWFFFWTNDRLC